MEFVYYDIKVAVLIAVFYMFYRLLLARENLHRLNRAVLLGTAIASFILPLCVITIHHTELLPTMEGASAPVGVTAVAETEAVAWWERVVPAVFWTGVAVSLYTSARTVTDYQLLPAKGQAGTGVDALPRQKGEANIVAADIAKPEAGTFVEKIIETKDSADDRLSDATIVVDGKVVTQAELMNMNPDDIVAIKVNKDKETLEKYGAKSMVINVITKQNHESKKYATDEAKRDDVLIQAEHMPQFNGNISEYLSQNIKYPKVAADSKATGRAIVRFVVNADGQVSDAQVVNSKVTLAKTDNSKNNPADKKSIEEKQKDNEQVIAESKAAFEAEALRVVSAMPAWKPGTDKGKPVAVYFTLPVRFAIK